MVKYAKLTDVSMTGVMKLKVQESLVRGDYFVLRRWGSNRLFRVTATEVGSGLTSRVRARELHAWRASHSEVYIANFLEKVMKNHPGLTCRLVFRRRQSNRLFDNLLGRPRLAAFTTKRDALVWIEKYPDTNPADVEDWMATRLPRPIRLAVALLAILGSCFIPQPPRYW